MPQSASSSRSAGSPQSLRGLLAWTLLVGSGAAAGTVGLTRNTEPPPPEVFVGTVVSQSTPVVAHREGTLLEILAAPGATVGPGEALFRCRDQETHAKLERTRQEIASLQLELSESKARAAMDLAGRVESLDREIHETRLKASSLLQTQFDCQLELRAREEAVAQVRPAAASFDVSISPMQDEVRLRAMVQEESTRNAAEVAAAQLQLCEARLRDLGAQKAALPKTIERAAGVDRLESRIAAAKRELATLEVQPREFTVDAPTAGTIAGYRRRNGERVPAGEAVLELLDGARRVVGVRVPAERADLFTSGGRVALQFPGGRNRTGIVQEITPASEAGDGGFAELSIRPLGQPWPEAAHGEAVRVVVERR